MNRSVNSIVNCTNMNLRKATRLVTQAYDSAMHVAGIKSTQFTLMATLNALGHPAITRLAEVMVMDRTTLSRNLKPLVSKGLVFIGSEQDQRVRQISLTAEGKAVLNEAMPEWQQIQDTVVERMGQERWTRFLADLETLVEVMKAAS